MLTQMNLTNFKSWQQTGDLRLAPLTGFFGANSSGKSSLLQMLLMLKATTESSDRNVLLETTIKDYVPMGALPDIVHKGKDEIGVSVEWEFVQPLQIDTYFDKVKLSIYIGFMNNINFLQKLSYDTGHSGIILNRPNSIGISTPTSHSIEIITDDTITKKIEAVNRIKSYDFETHHEMPSYIRDLPRALEQQFNRVYHLGPVREYAERTYIWGGEKPFEVGRKGERSIAVLLAGGDEMIKKVGEWLSKMRLSDSFSVRKIIGATYQIELGRIGSDNAVLLPDVGFGISQVLPVLVACYAVPEGSTLLIEQPEMHLHPSAQAVLADMFIEVVQERKVQLIIESHSEHLLARLQRRMAENKLDVNDTAFYFCRLEAGVSQIEALELDKYGEIKNYPHDFFGDLTGDVFERAKASIEQRMQQVAE